MESIHSRKSEERTQSYSRIAGHEGPPCTITEPVQSSLPSSLIRVNCCPFLDWALWPLPQFLQAAKSCEDCQRVKWHWRLVASEWGPVLDPTGLGLGMCPIGGAGVPEASLCWVPDEVVRVVSPPPPARRWAALSWLFNQNSTVLLVQ